MATTTRSKKSTPTVRVTLSTFDQGPGPIYRSPRVGVTLTDFAPITADDYEPRGATPLLDAVVEFVEHLRSLAKRSEVNVGLLLDESGSMAPNQAAVIAGANEFVSGLQKVKRTDPKVAGKGFLVITTDGYENASSRHGYEQVRQLIAKCEADGWVTVFLGAGIDGWAQGRQLGFSGGARGQTVSTVSSPAGTFSAMAATSNDARFYLSDSSGYVRLRANSGKRSLSEDGVEIASNIAVPDVGAYNAAEAIRRATESLEG